MSAIASSLRGILKPLANLEKAIKTDKLAATAKMDAASRLTNEAVSLNESVAQAENILTNVRAIMTGAVIIKDEAKV